MTRVTRAALLTGLAASVAALPAVRTALVGVDGVDGAGKTVFADELGAAVAGLGRPVVRAGIDSFHHPMARRYRRGSGSPLGYYLDSFDLDLVRRVLLEPLRTGDGRYRAAAFDHVADSPVEAVTLTAPPGAVLVFDGVFTHRPQLRGYWDLSVFLRVDPRVSSARCHDRDGPPRPGADDRYAGGQRLYLAECAPESHATVVVDNTDLAAPTVLVDRRASRLRGTGA